MTSELLRRRVPQILGVYLAVGWGVLEFTDWLVNRYVLSPHLTDFSLVAWGLMIPSVLLLAWFHGAPGRDQWTRVEKFGVPANLAIGATLLVVMFGGRDLGAATESVTLEDETGRTIERSVPKSEFRKSLTPYFFDNASGDTALDWLQYGIPYAIEFDLEQDPFINSRDTESAMRHLREEGFAEGVGVPLPLQRKVADQLHLSHFLAGQVSREAEKLAVTTFLYETRRGRLLQTRTFTGDDVFQLVDQLTSQLKRDLEIPAQHIEETSDLPVSELLTRSLSAFRSFVEAGRARTVQGDMEAAARYLEDAVEEDPQFALAHLVLWNMYFNLNRMREGERALESGMELVYKLPERTQFQLKSLYYWIVKQDIDKAQTAAGLYAELYPDDVDAHLTRARFYRMRNEQDRAIGALERALELDPERLSALLAIGDAYEIKGQFDKAVGYYRRYATASPNDPAAFVRIGDVHRLRGEHEAAEQEYQKALVLDPNSAVALARLAAVESDLGRFQAALAGYEEALAASVTAEQRAAAYESLASFYELRGQPSKAIEYYGMNWAEVEKYEGPFLALQNKLQNLNTYAAAGMVDVARDTLRSIEAQLDSAFLVLLPLGRLGLYLELEQVDSIEAAIPGVERFIEAFGLESARYVSLYAQGRVLELRGEPAEAIVSYRRALELEPRAPGFQVDIGRALRKAGALDEAESELRNFLEIRPFHPLAHYELALVYADRGARDTAIEHLRTALQVWENADTAYKPAQRAREKLAELSSTL